MFDVSPYLFGGSKSTEYKELFRDCYILDGYRARILSGIYNVCFHTMIIKGAELKDDAEYRKATETVIGHTSISYHGSSGRSGRKCPYIHWHMRVLDLNIPITFNGKFDPQDGKGDAISFLRFIGYPPEGYMIGYSRIRGYVVAMPIEHNKVAIESIRNAQST